ncbi:Transcription initiation factor TFIID subunit 12 [Porphyridium purpureum]|uniref:Transcription initiation factor TFIID subunit 12 n=1 Tax=Porphyridium purpureum TaxID=35688 RepID=A0A5J4YVY1_PORPP|nr:Transcription initiation factor TFIID subunit 12 [Porphyridium purpureum]|eukprot:POR8123..scf209_3
MSHNVNLHASDPREIISSAKLTELLQEVAPGETLRPEVEEMLRAHAEEFIESVTEQACKLARHRGGTTLEARDIQMHLEKNWNVRVPGYGDDPKPVRRAPPNPVHQQRLQQVQKAQQQP